MADFSITQLVNESASRALENLAGFDEIISDLRDETSDQRLQYVDMVMEGGGVLGIALAGYTYALEQAGIRFKSVGGTSAGAINATLLAAADQPGGKRAERVACVVADVPFMSFVDGGRNARLLMDELVHWSTTGSARKFRLAWYAFRNRKSLFAPRIGINPGDAFERWLADQLKSFPKPIRTISDLNANMADLPDGVKYFGEDTEHQGKDPRKPAPTLKLVTSELLTKSKVVLPSAAGLYFENAEATLNPAKLVRMSMSVPYFFEPVRLTDLPDNPPTEWKKRIGWNGTPPTEALFVDGGILSNFPIALFHGDATPRCPTLGAKLGIARQEAGKIAGPGALFGAMFSAARQAADLDFLWRNAEYQLLVGTIDTGAVHWLNFKLTPKEQSDLFSNGIIAARDFLFGNPERDIEYFDWPLYKQRRQETPQRNQAQRNPP